MTLATSAHSSATDLTADPGASTSAERTSALGAIAAAWGVGAHVAVVIVAVAQLLRAAQRGLAATEPALSTWPLIAACLTLFCYFQGYRGFQRGFSRLLVARAAHLARRPSPWHALAAPLYVCGLVHASARRRLRSTGLFLTIPALSAGVNRLPEPFHAAVDLGVAAGLTWGLLSMAVLALRAVAGQPPGQPLDLPGEVSP